MEKNQISLLTYYQQIFLQDQDLKYKQKTKGKNHKNRLIQLDQNKDRSKQDTLVENIQKPDKVY